jgi:predicted metal-dependent phosphoesterase TrpH
VLEADDAKSLRGFLTSIQAARRQRLRDAIQELRLRGIFITESDVFRGAAESFGRLHLARAIQNAGYVKNVNEAFSRFLNEREGAVPQIEVAPRTVTELVHRLGGIVIWAHPDPEEFTRHIDELQAAGIDGAETHNFRRRDLLDRLTPQVRERGLLASGGSDWHGSKQEAPLGTNALGADLAEPLLQALEKRAA